MMKVKFFVVFGLLSFGLSSSKVGAVTEDAKVDSIYFASRSDGPDFLTPWKRWLRIHRYIATQPKLSRQLQAQQQKLRKGRELDYASGKFNKLSVLPEAAVQRQSTDVYTLQLASFKRESGVAGWLKNVWLKRHMEQRLIYARVPKSLRMFAESEGPHKTDPLYVESAPGRHAVRVLYGVYASAEDADADRRELEKRLGAHFLMRRRPLTNELILNLWFEPVAGRYLNVWDTM